MDRFLQLKVNVLTTRLRGQWIALSVVGAMSLMLSSCAQDAQRAITPGQTSEVELVKRLGPAEVAAASPSRPSAELRSYSECDYQVEAAQVVARFCSPQASEKTLQYWRQLWRAEKL